MKPAGGRSLTARAEAWPIAGAFSISRGSKTEARVVICEISDGSARGRGECVPYPRYGETQETVLAAIEDARAAIEAGCGREALQGQMPPGAARNAVDCALWDLEAKASGVRVWRAAGLDGLAAVETAFTISLGTPEVMGAAARAAADRPLLKLKIGGPDDLDRIASVRAAAPGARLIVDANEALNFDDLVRLAVDFARLGVELIEQPLPAGSDHALADYAGPVPLCADESLHSRAELAACARLYSVACIKLDKSGGLTEALALKAEALALGMQVMAGCMVSTSLSMAPGMLIAQGARFVDLDGPLLLAKDRRPGLVFAGSTVMPPEPALWG